MTAAQRHNVTMTGEPGAPVIVFAHGFGCDQHVWRLVAPRFATDHRVVLFDHIGFGGADASAFDLGRHGSMHGYAADVLDLCAALQLGPVTFVGHSASAMIGVLAAIREPERFARLVLVTPSPRHVDEGAWIGGLSRADVDELIVAMQDNAPGWSSALAQTVMGRADLPDLTDALAESFCRMDPDIGPRFARLAFLSDHRADLPNVTTRTLVLQCEQDALAPVHVGEHVHGAIAGSVLRRMRAVGHCPQLSAPEETVDVIRGFL